MPFASINDHKSLAHVFDQPTRASAVSVAARDRLKRWAEYLRSFTFTTTHIPGAENHFCDLLSRHGCRQTAESWKSSKATKHACSVTVTAPPQMAIIEPTPMPDVGNRGHRDMDIQGEDLMPAVKVEEWPTPERLRKAQDEGNVNTGKLDKSTSTPLYINKTGKIAIPPEHPTTMEVIAICRQGDLAHRSAINTIKEFRRTFAIHGLQRKAEEEYIKACVRRCLSCLKTRAGKVIPRPL